MIQEERNKADTATQILDAAERLIQIRGFNAFSYADISSELKITKAALHYHFASKAKLGAAVIARYAARFAEALAAIESRDADAAAKLDAYAELYLNVLREQRMCLCGMMAADYQTLPEPMRNAIVRFFDDNEVWLMHILKQGRNDKSLQFTGSPRDVARTIVSSLEGAMLTARPYGDIKRFRAVAKQLLAGVKRGTPEPART